MNSKRITAKTLKKKPQINLDRKILGEPYPLEMPGMAERARRNLLISCGITLIILIGGLSISEDSAFLGIQFEGLTSQTIYWALLIFIVYESLHFCWHSWNQLAYWRIRLTGVQVVFRTEPGATFEHRGGGGPRDFPDEKEQSSLSNWWLENAQSVNFMSSINVRLENQLRLVEESGENTESLSREITELNQSLKKLEELLASKRIQKSLISFDKWYALLIASQGYRWLVLETGLPILLALISMGGLVHKIIYCS